jgi:hypothetical protein
MEEQIKSHTDFSTELNKLNEAPAYARYFGSLAQSALARNPYHSATRKTALMTELVDGLQEAMAAVNQRQNK